MVDTVPSAETCATAVVSGARVAKVARGKARKRVGDAPVLYSAFYDFWIMGLGSILYSAF
ncbi:MAG: hypothetical protein HC862_22480 [Scytonema sp. RU_4_4]|nr:hypothetical protein [Scytonema sp. RU_4_4]